MLNWLQPFNIFSFLESHTAIFPNTDRLCLAAAGCIQQSSTQPPFIPSIDQLYQHTNDWLFGHFCYDWKQELHNQTSTHNDYIGFADAFLFVPELVIELYTNELHLHHLPQHNPQNIFNTIINQPILSASVKKENIHLQPVFTKKDFIETIQKIQTHIKQGDCYEINICQEWFARDMYINPLHLYNQLQQISPNPFACLYRNNNAYTLCASPERFLQKKGNTLRSQPIKGTNKRIAYDDALNAQQQIQLQQNPKERAENIMIVDLVRNDLSRICKIGSVEVDALLQPYAFPQVNHLISTITGTLEGNTSFSTIMKALFPMGSMTGAPKKKVMELTEKYERSKRGLYAGTIGYITPNKDFDFNVVIRSFLYNQTTGYLSYQVGGGITHYSDAAKEYEECLLKATALQKALRLESVLDIL